MLFKKIAHIDLAAKKGKHTQTKPTIQMNTTLKNRIYDLINAKKEIGELKSFFKQHATFRAEYDTYFFKSSEGIELEYWVSGNGEDKIFICEVEVKIELAKKVLYNFIVNK